VLLQNEIHPSSTVGVLRSARKATTFVNPSPLPSAKEIREFPWELVDWVIVNEAETREMYYRLTGEKTKMSTRELVSALSNVEQMRETNIVCTLGENGVLVFMPRFHRAKSENETASFMYMPAAKLGGRVKDSTGAGDTFAGYFVRGMMGFGGQEIGEQEVMGVLKVCVQAAGKCVERAGAMDSIPCVAEL
jgi:ribokinase